MKFTSARLASLVILLLVPLTASADTVDSVLAFFESLPLWLAILTTMVTAATAVTMVTPSKSDDRIINALLRVLNIMSGNVMRNKNEDE